MKGGGTDKGGATVGPVVGVGDGRGGVPVIVVGAGGALTLLISVDVLASGKGAGPRTSDCGRLAEAAEAEPTSAWRPEASGTAPLPRDSGLVVETLEPGDLQLPSSGLGMLIPARLFSNRGGSCPASTSSETE